MLRNGSWVGCLFAVLVLPVLTATGQFESAARGEEPPAAAPAGQPAAEPKPDGNAADHLNLLPGTTRALFSITDFEQFQQHWDQTQLGKLLDDPAMDPFVQDMKRQVQNRWFNLQERLGLTLDDLQGVPGGQVSLALSHSAQQEASTVMLIDVRGHLEQARAVIQKATANLTRRGAKQSQASVAGTTVTTFDVPPPAGSRRTTNRRVAYFLRESEALLAATDDLATAQEILTRLGGEATGSLSESPTFRKIADRLSQDAGAGYMPQVRWYIEPLALAEAIRSRVPPDKRSRGKSTVDILRNQGFSGLQGVGGFVDLAVDGPEGVRFEALHRTAVLAPKPYQGAMKMVDVLPGEVFSPQTWVPRDVAAYATGYTNLLTAFDNFGPLFDELVGEEGETGVWQDVLKGLKDDEEGPQIDLRAELFAHLGSRISILTDYREPIGPGSERILIALQCKDDKAVTAALEKMFKEDPTMRAREHQGHIIWETIPLEEETGAPSVSLTAPPLGVEGEAEFYQESPPIFPNASWVASSGELMIASHYDFLSEVLTPREERQSLGRDVEYRIVTATLDAFQPQASFARAFTRLSEQARPSYELLRQGKMSDSDTLAMRLLTSLFGEEKEKPAETRQKLDFSKLPEYDAVRRYLGLGGTVGTALDDGWYFRGVVLPP